jgi:hypothetical protein
LGGRGRRISEFEASLVYKVSSRTARAIQRNPVSKNKNKNKKQKTTKKKKTLQSSYMMPAMVSQLHITAENLTLLEFKSSSL